MSSQPEAPRQPQPEAQREAQPEARREAQPEARREAQPEARREAQPEARREAQPEPRREAQPEARREAQPEAWMRGPVPGIHPVNGHLLRASEQIREDAHAAIGHLTTLDLWATPLGVTSAGFHALHLAGSTQRLCSYLEGRQLSSEQLDVLKAESTPGTEPAAALLSSIEQALHRYETLVRSLAPEQFGDIREIGRKRFRTTAVSLAIHIAEHGQRHIGGMIAAAKLAHAAAASAS